MQLLLVEVLAVLYLAQLVRNLLDVPICLIQETVEEVHLPSHQSIRLLLLHVHLHSLTVA